MRLRWSDRAVDNLEVLAARAPAQAAAVYESAEWLAGLRTPRVGRRVRDRDEFYWPAPSHGIFYFVEGQELIITEIVDVRRRRQPW